MLTYLRYALAIVCFALSVGCLALWRDSVKHKNRHYSAAQYSQLLAIEAAAHCGNVDVVCYRLDPQDKLPSWSYLILDDHGGDLRFLQSERQDAFGLYEGTLYFPLWYPALVFALAGVGALRLGRRFTLRSAIIATAVVAGLLGMAVAL